MSHRTRALLAMAHVAALWPTLGWWSGRVAADTDELWGVAAWPIALWMIRSRPTASLRPPILSAVLLTLYGLSYGVLPSLLSAVIGVVSIAATWSALYLGRSMSWPLCVVLILSLPLEASLQFYLGFPLRFTVASIAAPMLGTLGLDVIAVGTQLSWSSFEVSVDGPCSGVRMLRIGLLFSCLLSLRADFAALRFATHLAFTVFALVIANALRATSLFLLEVTHPPGEWLHAGAGVVAFALLLASQYGVHTLLGPRLVPLGATP